MRRITSDSYQDRFTWRNKLGEHCIAHHDGTCSAMMGWDGLDYELLTDKDCWDATIPIFNLLHSLDPRLFYEFHWWREKDDSSIEQYLAQNDQLVRGGDFAKYLRTELGEHWRPFVRVNECALVASYSPPYPALFRHFIPAKNDLHQQTKRGERLIRSLHKLTSHLPGAWLMCNDDYEQRILRTANRAAYLGGAYRANPWIFLNHQWVRKFDYDENAAMFYHGRHWHKIIFVSKYPDALPGWFKHFSYFNINMHVSMILKPMDVSTAARQSENAEKFSGAHTAQSGREFAEKHLADETSFRKMMVDNDLMAFRNTIVFHLYDENQDNVNAVADTITKTIENHGGQPDSSRPYQQSYFRYSQPGQGYKSAFLRKDHTWQVGAMLPTQVYRGGDAYGEQFNLGWHGQPVWTSYRMDEVNHSLVSAKTGSGKDVKNQQTVLESFTTGTNLYLLECGDSYQWMFQALGGKDAYLTVDPEETVVSPFPPFSAADYGKEYPLPGNVMTGTIRSLAFLLMDDTQAGSIQYKMPVAYQSAAEAALRMLYAVPNEAIESPLFEDFYQVLDDPYYLDNDQEIEAAKRMAGHLGSFLGTQAGQLFNRPANLQLNNDIIGVNLEPVMENPTLFSFYLVFFSLRLSHMANASAHPSRFILNEFHVFVKQAYDIVGGLMDGVARMGRKRGHSLDLVTQELEEMDVVSKSIISALSHITLLYREDMWAEIGARFGVPPHLCDVWQQFPKPDNLPYRNCLRKFDNEYYNLLLTYPDAYLNFCSTKKSHLILKRDIGRFTTDPFERLRLMTERLNQLDKTG